MANMDQNLTKKCSNFRVNMEQIRLDILRYSKLLSESDYALEHEFIPESRLRTRLDFLQLKKFQLASQIAHLVHKCRICSKTFRDDTDVIDAMVKDLKAKVTQLEGFQEGIAKYSRDIQKIKEQLEEIDQLRRQDNAARKPPQLYGADRFGNTCGYIPNSAPIDLNGTTRQGGFRDNHGHAASPARVEQEAETNAERLQMAAPWNAFAREFMPDPTVAGPSSQPERGQPQRDQPQRDLRDMSFNAPKRIRHVD
ncbi:hypothetical protein F4810DRAFT_720896 [Camillea tinctor]|nr:hypothetical protein F4810DRAFT_720896 [Camillea tinctor]